MIEGKGPYFPLRGVIEGFYGSFFTFPERNDLLRFLGETGFNFYLYGPKNDRQHRMRWWEPYPPSVMKEFAHTLDLARRAGVTFCYAISFGMPLNYASDDDFAIVTEKLRAFYDLGCRAFAILQDDISGGFSHEVNQRSFPSVAHAHAAICNRVHRWLGSLDEPCSLHFCPSEYSGKPPFGRYLVDLGEDLHPDVDVFYTGPDVCSRSISVSDVQAFGSVIRRQPILWDNYPVNDALMTSQMHIGPLCGRDPDLFTACRGYAANLMNQPEASKIPLATIAEYLANPHEYDPDAAWLRALERVAGKESLHALHRVAESSLTSVLYEDESPRLNLLATSALVSVRRGDMVSASGAVWALKEYLDVLDESCYQVKNRMQNVALRQNLLPWIEGLEDKVCMTRSAISTLEAVQNRNDVTRSVKTLEAHLHAVRVGRVSIGGQAVLRLAGYARKRAKELDSIEWRQVATETESARESSA